jgi:hypothetical protein
MFFYFYLFQYEATAAASVSWDCLVPICFYTAILFSTRLQQRPRSLGIAGTYLFLYCYPVQYEATAAASVSWDCLVFNLYLVLYCYPFQYEATAAASVSWDCLVPISFHTAILFSTRLQQRPQSLGIAWSLISTWFYTAILFSTRLQQPPQSLRIAWYLYLILYCYPVQYEATAAASVSWDCLVSTCFYNAILFSTRLQQRPQSLGIAWSPPVFTLLSFLVRGYSSGLGLLGLPGFYLLLHCYPFQFEATAAASVSWDCLVSTCFHTAILFSTRLQQRPLSLGIAWSPPFLYCYPVQYEATAAAFVSWDFLVSTCYYYIAIFFSTRLQQRPLFLGILPVFILQSFSVRGYSNGLSLLGLPGLGLGTGKRKKSWTRAVFSNLQRKGKI